MTRLFHGAENRRNLASARGLALSQKRFRLFRQRFRLELDGRGANLEGRGAPQELNLRRRGERAGAVQVDLHRRQLARQIPGELGLGALEVPRGRGIVVDNAVLDRGQDQRPRRPRRFREMLSHRLIRQRTRGFIRDPTLDGVALVDAAIFRDDGDHTERRRDRALERFHDALGEGALTRRLDPLNAARGHRNGAHGSRGAAELELKFCGKFM